MVSHEKKLMDMFERLGPHTEAEWAGAFETGKGWALRIAGADQVQRVAALDDSPLAPPDGYIALAAAVTGDRSMLPSRVQETMTDLFDEPSPTHAELLGFVEAVTTIYRETR